MTRKLDRIRWIISAFIMPHWMLKTINKLALDCIKMAYEMGQQDERSKIVAWLLAQDTVDDCIDMETEDMCAAIKAGKHLK